MARNQQFIMSMWLVHEHEHERGKGRERERELMVSNFCSSGQSIRGGLARQHFKPFSICPRRAPSERASKFLGRRAKWADVGAG